MFTEKGTFSAYFFPTKKVENFCGPVIASIIGDDIGQRASLGLVTPTGNFPSRFFETRSIYFKDVIQPQDRIFRDPKFYKELIPAIHRNLNTAGLCFRAKEIAALRGLTGVLPARLSSIPFANNFYLNHYNCFLHLELEGNLDRWLLYFGLKYGKDFCIKANDHAKYITETNRVHFNFLLSTRYFHFLIFRS